jgi:hypothetical protein
MNILAVLAIHRSPLPYTRVYAARAIGAMPRNRATARLDSRSRKKPRVRSNQSLLFGPANEKEGSELHKHNRGKFFSAGVAAAALASLGTAHAGVTVLYAFKGGCDGAFKPNK